MYRGLCGQLEKASENKFSKLQTNLINVMRGNKTRTSDAIFTSFGNPHVNM